MGPIESLWEHVNELVVTGFIGLCSYVTHTMRRRSERIDKRFIDHDKRITEIEVRYVSRSDLSQVMGSLHEDLNQGFDRANGRIDELYKNENRRG